MISRVAEACFWMYRQVERADSMARMLRVNRSFVLDTNIEGEKKWYSMLVASGEHELFDQAYPRDARSDGDIVQEYLVWERDNPVSIYNTLYWARENARTIRDVISLEMWEVLNDRWQWLKRGPGRRVYRGDPDAFYRHISGVTSMFQGTTFNTMLRNKPLDFMQLGMFLERAGQTARILDVHYHTFTTGDTDRFAALAEVQWLALLRCLSATASFARSFQKAPTGPTVVDFFIFEDRFPRSVLHSLERSLAILNRINRPHRALSPSATRIKTLRDSLLNSKARELATRHVHAEVTRLVDGALEVCQVIHDEYFDPVQTLKYSGTSAN